MKNNLQNSTPVKSRDLLFSHDMMEWWSHFATTSMRNNSFTRKWSFLVKTSFFLPPHLVCLLLTSRGKDSSQNNYVQVWHWRSLKGYVDCGFWYSRHPLKLMPVLLQVNLYETCLMNILEYFWRRKWKLRLKARPSTAQLTLNTQRYTVSGLLYPIV